MKKNKSTWKPKCEPISTDSEHWQRFIKLLNRACDPNWKKKAGPPRCKQWEFYLVRCSDGSLYSGVTTDVIRRLSVPAKGSTGFPAKD
jgi:hypothetical protein